MKRLVLLLSFALGDDSSQPKENSAVNLESSQSIQEPNKDDHGIKPEAKIKDDLQVKPEDDSLSDSSTQSAQSDEIIGLDDKLGVGVEGTFLPGGSAHSSAIVQIGPAISYDIFFTRVALSFSAMYSDARIFRISGSALLDLNLARLGVGKSVEYKNAPGFNFAAISTYAYTSFVLESGEIYFKISLPLDKPSEFYVISRGNIIGYKHYF